MINHTQIYARIIRDVDKCNARFGKWEQIKEIRLLPEPFTIEGGELTPTLKLKRKAIMNKYKGVIETIYAPR
jgi:long-chain acyl-CoA synthetase